MIKSVVSQWDARKDALREWLGGHHPDDYEELVGQLVRLVLTGAIGRDGPGYDLARSLDPARTTVIDHGGYQGTQIFLLCRDGYRPDESDYLWFDNGYGSCSSCDTPQAISNYSDDPPDEGQVKQYMDLALHMVQRIKWLQGDDAP